MKEKIRTLVLLLSSLVVTLVSNYVIVRYFPNRLVNPDLVFKLFPYSLMLEYFSDAVFFFSIILFTFYYFIPQKKKLTDYLNMISVMYLLRAVIMVLTPMMRPTGVDIPSHGFFRDITSQLGMYPSGHIALLALLYFSISKSENVVFKRVFLILLIVNSLLMIISRGHYSIDVVGGIMLSYIVATEFRKLTK